MQPFQKNQFIKCSSQQQTIQEVYTFSNFDKLGQGSYGSVYKGIHKITLIERAIKVIHKANVKQKERLKMELQTVELLDHPHVIRVFETYEDIENIYVVMEICKGGDIFDKVLELGHFREQQALKIFVQIVRSVYYYQNLNIVHRDLKPENFLFQIKNDLDSLYIIDFGLARIYTPGVKQLWTKTGTAYYVAPEVLQGKYDNLCDIWSLGVILYVLLCGYPPFYGETEQEILQCIQTGKFEFDGPEWCTVSNCAKDLIMRLLTQHEKRLTAGEILKHEWLGSIKSEGQPLLTKQLISQWMSYTKLKQTGLLYLATQIEQSEIKDIKQAFLFMNKSQSGILFKEEIIQQCQIEFENLQYFQFIAICLKPSIFKQEKYLKLMYLFLSKPIVQKEFNIQLEADYQAFSQQF